MNWYTHMLHRIGRTGRVGNTGRATSFFDERENAGLARSLVKVTCCLAMQNASSLVFMTTMYLMNKSQIQVIISVN